MTIGFSKEALEQGGKYLENHRCSPYHSPIYTELKKLFLADENAWDRVYLEIKYWTGFMPYAAFSPNTNQEEFERNFNKYKKVIADFHGFSREFFSEHYEIACHDEKGFAYLTQMVYLKYNNPKVFQKVKVKFKQEYKAKGDCFPRPLKYSDCQESEYLLYDIWKYNFIGEDKSSEICHDGELC